MTFRLQKHDTGPTLTKFYVRDSSNGIVGTINVLNEQAADLQRCWNAPPAAPAAKAADKAERSKQAIVSALRKGPKLSRQAILRGS